jgi:hypothetical protein
MTVSPGSTISAAFRRPGWLRREDCSIDDFRASVQAQTTDLADYPHAAAVERGVPLYDSDLAVKVRDPQTRREVQAEIVGALTDPGSPSSEAPSTARSSTGRPTPPSTS